MARNNRHNTAFVVGSIVGAAVGAAAALWKTPYTGEELRAKISGGGASGSETVVARPASEPVTGAQPHDHAGGRSIKDKVLSTVEKTLAPVVGVELGKTAGGSDDIRVNAGVAGQGGATAPTSHAADGSETIGLSRDRLDADRWAAAYGGTSSSMTTETPSAPQTTVASTPTPPASTGTTRPAAEAPSGSDNDSTLLGMRRDRIDAAKWASAYGTAAGDGASSGTTSTASTSSAARESAEQTGRGANPAFPGDDGDMERHPPVDRGASDNVTPAAQDDPRARNEPGEGPDAASIDKLTTPQVDRTPDALQQATERSMHPFPKLGGKES